MDLEDAGYIYVMKNSHMPDLVKIGFTRRTPIQRAKELYRQNTSVPGYFWVKFQTFVYDPELIEKTVHDKLASRRVNEFREFFEMSVEEAKDAIMQVVIEMNATCDRKAFISSRQQRVQSSPSQVETYAEYNPTIWTRIKGGFSLAWYLVMMGIGTICLSGLFLMELVKWLFSFGMLFGIAMIVISFFVSSQTSDYIGYALSALWVIASLLAAYDETKKAVQSK